MKQHVTANFISLVWDDLLHFRFPSVLQGAGQDVQLRKAMMQILLVPGLITRAMICGSIRHNIFLPNSVSKYACCGTSISGFQPHRFAFEQGWEIRAWFGEPFERGADQTLVDVSSAFQQDKGLIGHAAVFAGDQCLLPQVPSFFSASSARLSCSEMVIFSNVLFSCFLTEFSELVLTGFYSQNQYFEACVQA